MEIAGFMNPLVRVFHVALVAGVLCSAGCGSGSDKFKEARPKTVSAAGTVMYKGSPVVGATVELIPTAGGKIGASGMTDSSGHVVLKAYPPDSGVVPGAYD